MSVELPQIHPDLFLGALEKARDLPSPRILLPWSA